MIEILTSDSGILILAGVGLIATGVSILRDTRSQKPTTTMPQLSVISDEVADVEVAA